MRRSLYILSILLLGTILSSCEKIEPVFTIVGMWGMTEGSTDNTEYDSLDSGVYYETIEFKHNGRYVAVSYSDANSGVYTYDHENKFLQMKDSQSSNYIPVHVTIHSWREITLIMDYGKSGTITKHMVKLSD